MISSDTALNVAALEKLKLTNPACRIKYGRVVVSPAGPPFVRIYMMENELNDHTNKSIIHLSTIGIIQGIFI